jgi:hypothetical protein
MDPAPEMEGIGSTVWRYLPPFREAGLEFGVDAEAREPVKEVRDGAAGGDVGGECGIERAWVVPIA